MVEENKSIIDKSLGGFLIICPDCQKAATIHETRLYVNWDFKFYTIECLTCKKIVYFDFYGNQTLPKLTVDTIGSKCLN